jgi:hypothetical protein
MGKFIYMLMVLVSTAGIASAQSKPSDMKRKIGLKFGYNWSYLSGTAQGFNKDSKTGFMAGAFFAPPSKGLGYRSEIVFSRQGYSFDNGGRNTDVLNDYIYLPQLTTFTIAKKVQLQAGAQIGFLLNAQKTTDAKDTSIISAMNRIDYGFAGGVEIYPFKGLIIGGRYNIGLGKLYKKYEQGSPHLFCFLLIPAIPISRTESLRPFIGYKFSMS